MPRVAAFKARYPLLLLAFTVAALLSRGPLGTENGGGNEGRRVLFAERGTKGGGLEEAAAPSVYLSSTSSSSPPPSSPSSSTSLPPPSTSPLLSYLVVALSSFFTFLALAVVCDEYLCPAIDIVCSEKHIPDDIAGATLLAFGSSAPEIFMNLAATFKGAVSLSLPSILGSAIIAFGFIPPICAFAVPSPMPLRTPPLLRDTGIYCLSLALLWLSLSDGYIDGREAAGLTGLYFVYLAVLLVPYGVRMAGGKGAGVHAGDGCGEKGGGYEDIEGSEGSGCKEVPSESSEESAEESEGPVGRLISLCSKPFQLAFSLTVPTQPEDCKDPSVKKAFAAVFMSIVWVAVLSAVALEVAQVSEREDMHEALHA